MSAELARLIQKGLEHHRAGRLREAEACYQSVLQQQPGNPDALHLIGVIAHQIGRNELAVELIEKAIEANPREPDFFNNCGEAYRALGRFDRAIERYEQALAVRPDFAGARNNIGNALRDMGRLQEALASYEQALAADPAIFMAHNNIGVILKSSGRALDAIASFEKAIELMPDYAEAHNNLGSALHELGRPGEALTQFRRAIELVPDYAEAHNNMGNALRALGNLAEAETHYRRAAAIRPDVALVHYNLGIALDELGRPREAISSYEKALQLKPDYAEAHHNLGFALQELGKTDEAAARFRKALELNPGYASAHLHLSMLRPDSEQEKAITGLLQNPSLADNDAALCRFALGNVCNHAQQFDRAFDHFRQANDLKRRLVSHDPAAFSRYVDRLIATFTPELVRAKGASGSDSRLPVFIVGLPRSGTTLVEQILSSHPGVHGAGELESIGGIQARITARAGIGMSYPECMGQCDAALLKESAGEYLKELAALSPGAARISNKDLGNFHRLGLIAILFPGARIIHCRRDPLDTCVSIYFTHFARGGEFSFDLEELGRYYLDYRRLMQHWQQLLPDNLLPVQYEDLVRDQEAISRSLVEHIGLEWDDACLEFHQNERPVRTTSSAQVRQPVYTGSIGRWRRYETQLAGLKEILDQAYAD